MSYCSDGKAVTCGERSLSFQLFQPFLALLLFDVLDGGGAHFLQFLNALSGLSGGAENLILIIFHGGDGGIKGQVGRYP